MDEENQLDPEIEKSLRDTMDQAEKDVRQDGVASMAAYMRQAYEAYRGVGFGRAQSFFFTMVLYKGLLGRG